MDIRRDTTGEKSGFHRDSTRGNYNLLLEILHELMEQEEQEQLQEDSITLEMDPLTALVQERDAQAQRLHDLDLKYRKQRARRKRGV
jgi:hypothetical protein